jgi:hypothetical protein
MIQDDLTYPERELPERLRPENPESSMELELRPGERYGWWEDHEAEDSHEVAMVHGAVNNCRTRILLDTGASVSMIGLDLARRLKLKLRMRDPIRVSGLGGVPTYISASVRIKITLGPRIVYVMSVYVANIDEGVEVLLGMNFMHAAGVRLSVREGLVQLPDEETVMMYGDQVHEHLGLDLPVCPGRTLYLQPGEHAIVKIRYGQSNPQREVVWAGRGDRWVTGVIDAAKSWAIAVKVVNVSSKMVWIDSRTAVARIVEFGCFPSAGRYVRPGSLKYNEWQQLIFESVPSFKMRRRAEELERIRRESEPPSVPRPEYEWPTKLLLRSRPGSAEVHLAALHAKPKSVASSRPSPSVQVEDTQVSQTVDAGTQTDVVQEPPTDEVLKVNLAEAEDELMSETEQDCEPVRPELVDVQDESDRDDDIDDCPSQVMIGTPLYKLEQEYARCMRVSLEDLDLEPAVYIHEGSELMSQLRDELALLPELKDLSPECDIAKADVGVPGRTTPGEDRKLRSVLERHRMIFLGDGNAAPAPARGIVCDLDVGDAKPVTQRPRSIAPHVMLKVYELLKKLLETKLIENSDSPWASPIVIVLKKNGVDIRMCIDYRIVNGFIKLSNYPLPLIDDLLIGFERAMWFMSLDMASGFWAVTMTERAKLISAFVCPFGHFQWVRMPFGLKNAPLIYQAVINNCLWGFVRLPPEEEKLVDPDVLDFLGLDPNELSESEREKSESEVPVLTDQMTVFQRNIPTPSQMGPVLGRSSYIDDIAHGAPTWDELCTDLNALLFRLRYWNITVSLPKSEFGKLTIPYLSHEISAEGLRATPKIAKGVQDLPFPKTLKGVQSFLGSLNYYHKFIEDFPVVAAVLYELTDEQVRAGRDLSRAKESFEILKRKIVSTPLLRHPDRNKPYVIIPHPNKWAACAVLGQEYDGGQMVRYRPL